MWAKKLNATTILQRTEVLQIVKGIVRIISIFSSVLTVRGLPLGLTFRVEAVFLKLLTNFRIVFRKGTAS